MSLFEPLPLRCGATLTNRIALAPLTNCQSHDDGTLADDERRWLVRRAKGGFSLVTTCAAHVTQDGKGFPRQLGIWGEHQLDGLTLLAEQIAAEGALGVVQLVHGGARCPSALTGQVPWSASSFTEERAGFEVPRAATSEDLARVTRGFADAARRAAVAGFAGVEIHGAHGYLLSQFLSRTMNLRTDAYGGDLTGRARLLRDVTRAIRDAVPPSMIVGLRLSPEDFGFAHGLDVDEMAEVAAWAWVDGVDYVHVSLWDYRRPSTKHPDRHTLAIVRDAVGPSVPLFAAGKVWTPDEARELRGLGADVVALGRSAIVNPDWPIMAREPGWEVRRPPLSVDDYEAIDVSPVFAEYLRKFPNMVA